MSENNHKEWAPGLVALHVAYGGSRGPLLAARRPDGFFRSISGPAGWRETWANFADWLAGPAVSWEDLPDWGGPIWVGSQACFEALRERSSTPADLLRIARDSAATPENAASVVIFGEEYVKASDSQKPLAQAEATIETLRQDLRDAQMRRDDSVQCYAAEADSARAEVRNLRSEIDRLRARMDDIPGLLEGVLGFRPYEITAEGFGGSPPSLPKGRGLVAYTVETKYPDGRAITKATLACQE